jgi:hypothetical protein
MRDQLVAKASTDTGQHISIRDKHPCPRGIRTRDPSNQASNTYALDRVAALIGESWYIPHSKIRLLVSAMAHTI